jgi:hypothetical protein
MKFGSFSRWRRRPSPFPEWVTLAAPTVAAVSGTALVGVLPAVIVTGTRYMPLLVLAVGVPLVLLLVIAVLLASLLPRETGPWGGGDGPPPPPDEPPDGPPWWPSFEKAFRQHVREGQPAPAGSTPGGGDHRTLAASVPAAGCKRG